MINKKEREEPMERDFSACALQPNPLIRYTAAPTKYDLAPYKTLCALHLNDDGTDRRLFIQISEDEQNPHWIPVEELVIQAYLPLFDNPCFLEDCLNKVKNPEDSE
jgi:hypothetical protein